MRPKQTLKEYKKIYDETIRIQVQEVKLGDVTYHARCKVSMLEDMLQNAEESEQQVLGCVCADARFCRGQGAF